MLNSIIETLKIMGWLGAILGILAIVNILCGTITNINEGEKFSIKKLFKGLLKVITFYIGSVLTGIAFTMLPFINQMVTNQFNVELLSSEMLNTLSSVVVLGIIVATVTVQAKKAIENITRLSTMTSEISEETVEEEDLSI